MVGKSKSLVTTFGRAEYLVGLGVDQPGELRPQPLHSLHPQLPGIAVGVPRVDELVERSFNREPESPLGTAAQVDLVLEDGELPTERGRLAIGDALLHHSAW
jgi:hypothetical protein